MSALLTNTKEDQDLETEKVEIGDKTGVRRMIPIHTRIPIIRILPGLLHHKRVFLVDSLSVCRDQTSKDWSYG